MKFFTSDLHFWHKNVIRFCERPWVDVESMNKALINNWNERISESDQVYVLGDVFFCGTKKAMDITRQLNGEKFLVLGNHDWGVIKKHRAVEFDFEWAEDQFCIRLGSHDVSMSHFPYKNAGDHTEGEERFSEKRLEDKGNWLLHGHVHKLWKVKDKQINVGIDVWDYYPVSENEILKLVLSALAGSCWTEAGIGE